MWNLKKLLILFFVFVSNLLFSEEVVIKNADKVSYIREKDSAGYTKIELYSNVYIVYKGKSILADRLVIKFFNEEPKEIIGDGNIMIEDSSSIIIGKKFFYYLDSDKRIVYDAKTYNKPYFISGDYFKFVGEKRLIASDINFTNCTMFYPHYSISAKKAWIYRDDKDFFFGFSLKVGQDPIFYFPFMYKSYYGTGIITSVGNETIGWFVNNTYKTRGQNYDFKLMFDHYQKLGEYVGVEYKLSKPNIQIKTAGIYDKHVKYDRKNFTNFFEEVSGEGPVSGRSFRYKFDSSLSDTILDGNNFINLISSINLKYFETSDPFITPQYETRRLETFDPNKVLFPQESPSSMALQSGGSGKGRSLYFGLNNSFYGFSLNFVADFKWLLSMTDDTEKARNPYRPEYYKNYKSSAVFPSINFSKSFNIFNISSEKYSLPISLGFSGSYNKTKNYSLDVITSELENTSLKTTLNSPFTYKFFNNCSFNIPFTLTNTVLLTNTKSYSSGALSSDRDVRDIGISINNPIGFNLNFDSSSFVSSIPFRFSYKTYEQKTNNPTPTDIQNDVSNTYKFYSYSVGNDSTYSFLKDYEYLESAIQARITYSYSKKYDLPYSIYNTTENYNYFGMFSTLKSSVSFSTYTNTSPGVTGESREGPITIISQTKMLPFFTITNTHVYSRYQNKSKTNQLDIVSSINTKTDILEDFWLNKLNFSVTWVKNYIDYRLGYLNYNFSVDFNLTKLWQIIIVFSGQNNRLYYYTDKVSSAERRDFFDDFLKSIKLWSIKDREYTYFKMRSFGFNIKHDLHKWYFELSSSFTPKLDPNGSFYFESQIGFKLVLTELPSMSPPEIKKEYGK